jgi:hypothetical protein
MFAVTVPRPEFYPNNFSDAGENLRQNSAASSCQQRGRVTGFLAFSLH